MYTQLVYGFKELVFWTGLYNSITTLEVLGLRLFNGEYRELPAVASRNICNTLSGSHFSVKMPRHVHP